MSQTDSIYNAIYARLEKYDYKSANFQLALVKENQVWKIANSRIILDVSEPKENHTDHKQEDFVLENVSISIDEFKKFLEYLKKVYVGNIPLTNNTVNFTDDVLFKLGNYKLCFVGNFPSPEVYFFGREVGRKYHGIDRPIYFADYSIHMSASSKLQYRIDLSGSDVPFRNAIEALNYYWHTSYEQYNLPTNANIYFPNYDASIEEYHVEKGQSVLKISTDPTRVKINELNIGMILESGSKSYRKKYDILSNELKFKIEFDPSYGTIYLYKNKEKIDELNYQSPARTSEIEKLSHSIVTSSGLDNEINYSKVFSENKEEKETTSHIDDEIFSHEFVISLPVEIQSLLHEAEEAYRNKLYRATAILLRATLEEGITIMIKRTGKSGELYDLNGYEVGLKKKIILCSDVFPELRQIKEDLENIKWFGDKATHEPQFPILKRDILGTLEPKFRLFLAKFIESMK